MRGRTDNASKIFTYYPMNSTPHNPNLPRSASVFLLLILSIMGMGTAFAVTLNIKVNGLAEGEIPSATIIVHNGASSASAYFGYAGEDTENITTDNEDGTTTTVTVVTNRWATYSAGVGPEWTGRSICFSIEGTFWTALYPLLNDPSSYDLAKSQLENDPFPSENIDPNHNFTIIGNTAPIGRWWQEADRSVFTLDVWDNANPGWPCVGIDTIASTSNAYWRWFRQGSLAMQLDYLNRLTIRSRSNSANALILDPELGQILVNGNPILSNPASSTLRSVALGYKTVAQGYGQTVVGVNNVAVGSATNPTDPQSEIFVIGNGTYGVSGVPNQSSNAMSVKRNGNAMIAGALGIGAGSVLGTSGNASGQLVVGKYNDLRTDDAGVNHTEGALIVGNGTGPDFRSNSVRVLDDGTVLIVPRGDLDMGQFSGGPQP
jgi:hypothetical protein